MKVMILKHYFFSKMLFVKKQKSVDTPPFIRILYCLFIQQKHLTIICANKFWKTLVFERDYSWNAILFLTQPSRPMGKPEKGELEIFWTVLLAVKRGEWRWQSNRGVSFSAERSLWCQCFQNCVSGKLIYLWSVFR